MSDQLWYILGIPIIIVLVVLTVKRVAALKKAIDEHFEAEQNGPKDPYAQLAALAKVQQALDEAKQRRARKR